MNSYKLCLLWKQYAGDCQKIFHCKDKSERNFPPKMIFTLITFINSKKYIHLSLLPAIEEIMIQTFL